MSASAPSPAARHGCTGERVELARYDTPTERRIVCGQRVNGCVLLIDLPAAEEGRVYLIEQGLEQDGNAALNALLVDYLQRAERLQVIPARNALAGSGARCRASSANESKSR